MTETLFQKIIDLEGEIKGVLFCIILGISAYFLDSFLSQNGLFSLGSGTLSFILGGITAQLVSHLKKGGRWMIENILPFTIICLGFGLDISLLFGDGAGKIGVIIGILSALVCLISCLFIGKIFQVPLETSLTIGSGGAICGNSAVVAVSSPLRISQEVLALTLATVNILGIITFIAIPILSTILGMDQVSAGIWAGSTIHAVPQAISAGEAIGPEGMTIATTVKLSRVSLLVILVPICGFVANGVQNQKFFEKQTLAIPYFLPGFILASILTTWFLPLEYSEVLSDLGKMSLAPIMACIGFFFTKSGIGRDGVRILTIGVLSSIVMIIFSYFAIYLLV